MLLCARDHGFSQRPAAFLEQSVFKRTAVYAYPYRDILLPRHFSNSRGSVLAADIPGIDPYFIYPVFHTSEREPVIEMYIRHKRYIRVLLYILYRLRGRHIRYRKPDYIASRGGQPVDLLRRRARVGRERICHRLNRDLIIISYRYITDFDCFFTHIKTAFLS